MADDTRGASESNGSCSSAPQGMPIRRGWLQRLARSDRPLARRARRLYHAREFISLPVPRWVGRTFRTLLVAGRAVWHFLKRALICEPIFKAYCKQCGRDVHTGVFVHWIQGRGDLIVGDRVWVDGKCTFTFGARFAVRPVIEIGDGTGIGHGCVFIAGRRITIGRNCMLSGEVVVFDSSGHVTDPMARRRGAPPADEEVREVRIDDDVWIGMRCMIFPGVHVGRGATVSAGSIVRHHVPPYAVVAGNPARVIFRVPPPGAEEPCDSVRRWW